MLPLAHGVLIFAGNSKGIESQVAFNLELIEHASSVPISMWGFEQRLSNSLVLA